MSDAALMQGLLPVLDKGIARARQARPTRADAKARQDYVTDVDLAVDALLEQEIGALTPDIPVLSEERAVKETGTLDAYWIVDPIDGTMNLMSDLPFVGISIALVDENGPRLAAVASIADGNIFTAIRGEGATKNGEPLKLDGPPAELIVLSTGLLDTLSGDDGERYRAARAIGKLRNFGAQALHLCHVANGGFAAVASIEAKVWDEAAGGLVVREAGGIWRAASDAADWRSPSTMMGLKGQRSLAAHPDVFDRMAEILDPVLNA